jgi:hypothetical protein
LTAAVGGQRTNGGPRPAGEHSNGNAAVRTVAFIGGGPRTVGLLERFAANAEEMLGAGPAQIHIVDPYPAGGGRIWRAAQSGLLWMNSMARDVTIFTDESVQMAGPVAPGPTLSEWVRGAGSEVLAAAGLAAEAKALGPDDFASRQLQSHYLNWAYERAVAALPERVTVTEHRSQAVDLTDDATVQTVLLASGADIRADIVVLAQGFLDREPTDDEVTLINAAQQSGLTYLPPGYTADVDLSELRPGEPVIVRGFGLAFIDLMVLLGEGRGGTFADNPDGSLTYLPSGREPVLYVGSRRGVPYHAKLGYALSDGSPTPPRYFTPAAVTELGAQRRATGLHGADFRRDIWPLMVKELTAAHYRELFGSHPERACVSWRDFSAVLDSADVLDETFADAVKLAIPDPDDRFDLPTIDQPFAGRRFSTRGELSAAVVDYVRSDLRRRADPHFSSDAAVFDALLTVYAVLAHALTTGEISAADRVRFVEGQFHGLFSFMASGPPPRRLEELLALHNAGLVHFLGPDIRIDVVDNAFAASSPALRGAIRARALVDARLPRPDVKMATDPVIKGLLADGQLAAEHLIGPDGGQLGGGQLLADGTCRAIRRDLSVHPRRFWLGPSVSGSAGSAGFSRPGFNGPGFRQNDAVAREILRLLNSHSPASIVPETAQPTYKEIHHAR